MKIATLTYQRHDNYGAMLQCYALHTKLKEMGVEAEIIDYVCDVADKPFSPAAFRSKGAFQFALGVAGEITRIPRAKKFREFRKLLKMTKPYDKRTIGEIGDAYDGYIVGSDIVWNAKITGLDENYFLPFVADKRKRCSYAASFGSTDLKESLIETYRRNLSEFEILTSRERSGRDLIKKLTGKDALAVCDPTLLLTPEKWREMLVRPKEKEKYIVAYQLVPSMSFLKLVKEIAAKKGLKVLYIPFPYGFMRCKTQLTIGPLEWLGLFEGAEYIVTDSFHGCVFSTLFHKQFFVHITQLGERITNHLGALDLMERIVDNSAQALALRDIDYREVDPKLEEVRRDGSGKLRLILDHFESLGKSALEDRSRCTGCTRCMQACPRDAISMKKDELGFAYPEIDKSKCVECGVCYAVCGAVSPREDAQQEQRFYGAIGKDAQIVKSSSSGGAFYAAAKAVIERGGAVIGAAYREDWSVAHTAAYDMEELKKLMGSKYPQSDVSEAYALVRKNLQEGREVLFCGTPCQAAAVRAYCRRMKIDTEKLYLIDIFCHGVFSPSVWQRYIGFLEEKFGTKIASVSFRDKEKGWQNRYMKVLGEEKDLSDFCNGEASALSLYDKNIALRDSCYHCPYMSLNREGDLSLGDFWGVERVFPKKDGNTGVSAVIVNNEKGQRLLESIEAESEVFECGRDDMMQQVLCSFTRRPVARGAFIDLFKREGIAPVLAKYGRPSSVEKLKRDKLIPLMYRTHIFGMVSGARRRISGR